MGTSVVAFSLFSKIQMENHLSISMAAAVLQIKYSVHLSVHHIYSGFQLYILKTHPLSYLTTLLDREVVECYFPMSSREAEYWRCMQGCSQAGRGPQHEVLRREFQSRGRCTDRVPMIFWPIRGCLAAFLNARVPHRPFRSITLLAAILRLILETNLPPPSRSTATT